MQDRFDSLEFYAKTNTNSSVFHNLIPSTYYPSGNKNGGDTNSTSLNSSTGAGGSPISLNTSRSRTPAPIAPRPRLPMSSSSTLSSVTSASPSVSSSSSSSANYTNGGINYGPSSGASISGSSTNAYDQSYRSSSRPPSRQSSVERTPYSSFDNYSLGNSAAYGSTHRLSDFTTRSRNSSPIRSSYEPVSVSSPSAADQVWSSIGRTSAANGRSVVSGLPPHPTSFHYDSYSLRNKREPSAERFAQLRNRRDASQERAMRPSASSSFLTHRRSSFVDHVPSKYY